MVTVRRISDGEYTEGQGVRYSSAKENRLSDAITIRRATEADCGAIAALMTQLYREEGYERVSREGDISTALFAEEREVHTRAFVAFAGDIVVAALLYYPGYDTMSASVGYHLADIIVSPTHRRQSIGRRLVKRLATTALEEGKEWVSLTVLKTNQPARVFYHALGMTQVEVDFFAMGERALASLAGEH